MDFKEGDVVGVREQTSNTIAYGPIRLKEKVAKPNPDEGHTMWIITLGGDPRGKNMLVYEDDLFHWWPLDEMVMGGRVPEEINTEEAREYYKTHKWPKVSNTGYEGDPSIFNLSDLGRRPKFPLLDIVPEAVEGMEARKVWDKRVNLPFQNGPGVEHFTPFWPKTKNPERRESRVRNGHFAEWNAKKEMMRNKNKKQTMKNYWQLMERRKMRRNLNSASETPRQLFSLRNHNKGIHPLSNVFSGGRRTRRRAHKV